MVRVKVNSTKEDAKENERETKDTSQEELDREAGEGSESSVEEKERPLEEISKEDLIKRAKETQELAARNYDLYVRSQAEMDNMKKRFQREKSDWIKYANESLIKEILPVVDNLEKAIVHSKDENSLEALREGVELTLKGLRGALEKAGLEEIKALGEPFNPNFHEAMCEQADDCAAPGTVLQEFQKGYLLNERLIRPSMVIVSKKKSESEEGQG